MALPEDFRLAATTSHIPCKDLRTDFRLKFGVRIQRGRSRRHVFAGVGTRTLKISKLQWEE